MMTSVFMQPAARFHEKLLCEENERKELAGTATPANVTALRVLATTAIVAGEAAAMIAALRGAASLCVLPGFFSTSGHVGTS
jgi:hypothetical protein